MLEKAVTLKRFEYSLSGKEWNAQTDIVEKKYQKLDNTFDFDETTNKKPILTNYNKPDLNLNSNYSFYK